MNLCQSRPRFAVDLADLEGKIAHGFHLGGELGDARPDPRGAEPHGATHGARGRDVRRDARLGYAVLQGAHHALIVKKGQQVPEHGVVGRLLVQKKDQVVVAGHFLGSEGLYGNDELELAGDACAVAIQGGHVFGVGVDEVDRAPALSHQCADEDDRLQAGDTAEEGVIEG